MNKLKKKFYSLLDNINENVTKGEFIYTLLYIGEGIIEIKSKHCDINDFRQWIDEYI